MRLTREERRRAYSYIAGIALTGPVVGHMLFKIWNQGGRAMLRDMADIIPYLPGGEVGVEAIMMFVFGLYFTWLFLFANDYRKSYQGMLLGFASLLVLITTSLIDGKIIPNLSVSVSNFLSFAFGVSLALLSETVVLEFEIGGRTADLSGDLTNLSFAESTIGGAKLGPTEWAEFPIASRGVLWGIVIPILAALILALVQTISWFLPVAGGVARNPVILLGWVIFSLGFLYVLSAFVEIDSRIENKSMEILGPTASGKTLTAFALFQTTNRQGEGYDPDPNSEMLTLQEEHAEWDGEGWPFDNTDRDEFDDLRFESMAGKRFPKRVEIRMRDHAGEHLSSIRDRLVNYSETSPTRPEAMPDGGEEDSKEDGTGTAEEPEDIEIDELVGSTQDDEEGPYGDIGVGQADGSSDGSDEGDNDSIGGDLNDSDRFVVSEDETDAEDARDGSGRDSIEREPPKSEQGTNTSADDELEEKLSDDHSTSLEPDLGDAEGINSSKTDEQVTESDEEAELESDPTEEDSELQGTDQPDENTLKGEVDQALGELARRVSEADKLVMLIDCERMRGNDPTPAGDSDTGKNPRLREYLDILKHSDAEEAILVATKADHYLDGWQDTTGISSDDPSESSVAYSDFQDYVEGQLTGARGGQLQTLKKRGNTSKIQPVYFKTKDSDESKRTEPLSDENNNLIPVGFDKVIEAVGR